LIDPALDESERLMVRGLRSTIEGRISLAAAYAGHLSAMPDTELIHTLAQCLDLDPIEKQMLLERPGLRQRAEALAELLEMKRLGASMRGGAVH